MSAVTGSVAGPMLVDLDGIFGPLRTPFSREDEPLGRALAAAWRAGDWSEAFEFAAMALVARYNGAITAHVPWEWHEFETPPPRLAWMKDGQVFVRAPHEDAYTAEAEAMRGRWPASHWQAPRHEAYPPRRRTPARSACTPHLSNN